MRLPFQLAFSSRLARDRRLSLRALLLGSICLLLLVVLAIGSGLTYWHAIHKVQTEMRAAIAVGGRIVHNAVDDAEEVANPLKRLELLVADFNGDRHIRATLVGKDGTTLFSSNLELVQDDVPEWLYRLFMGVPDVVRLPLPVAFDGLGTLELRTDPRNEIAELWADIKLMLGVLALFCILTLFLVHTILVRTLTPLDMLSSAFARIGNPSGVPRLAETGPIEFARVYRGFNGMVDRLKEAQIQNQRLHNQLTCVQEEERADIARDLHDDIGPFLFAVDVDAAAIEQCVERKQFSEIGPRIAIVRDAVEHMRKHVRQILGRLRPADLLDMGLNHAIESMIAFWQCRQPDLKFVIAVDDVDLDDQTSEIVYRVIQESTSNAVRHGHPAAISISMSGEDGLYLEISDDGLGLAADRSTEGYGIRGMKERIASLGGHLEVASRKTGSGVIVSAWLPLSPRNWEDAPSQLPEGGLSVR
ncbi:MAG: histidine kinase [Hyphomicrobiaceae bacterium]